MTPAPDLPLPAAAPSADADAARLRDDLILHQQALDGSINAIAFADLGGTLTYVNRAFLRMWRHESTAEVLGRHASQFWDSAAAAEEIIAALHAGQQGWVGELTGIRSDGSSFTAELAASMVRDAQGEPAGLMASFLDATDRVHSERRLSALTRLYAVLSQVNAAIVRASDEQSLLQAICDIAVTAGGFRMAWIGMLDASNGDVRPVARAGHEVG